MSILRYMMTNSGFWDNLAVQTLDPDKPNYNPAVAIVLNNNGKGTVIGNPIIEGCGRYFLTKTQAAAITSIGTWFMSKNSITDSNNIVTDTIVGNYAFVNFDELVYFTQLKTLSSSCFQQCSLLASINIDNITTIGSKAFFRCYALIPHISQDTISIGSSAFESCTKVPASIDDYVDLYLPNLLSIGANAFCQCNWIKSITSLGNITSLEGSVFVNSSLATVDVQNITALGSSSFERCFSLTTVLLSDYLISIGARAFFRNTSMILTEIPSTVTSIGQTAFSRCTSIPYLHILNTIPATLGNSVFEETYYKLYVGDGSSQAHDNETLQNYLADSAWSAYSSRLDTWFNYLQTH